MRVSHHTGGIRLIAIGSVIALALFAAAVATARGPHVPTPSRAKSTQEMEGALAQEFGKQFTDSSHIVECKRRISRTVLKCSIYFRYHDVVWSGHGRNWRAVCNGNSGISKNPHHTCWYVNWRLQRFDERCHTEQHHSVAYCTEPVVLH